MTYDNANPYSVPPPGRCAPGVAAFVAWHERYWDLPSLGCYNPASTLPGGGPSLHRDGRAADVGHDGTAAGIAKVQELCARIAAKGVEIGCQQILFHGLAWRQDRPWHMLSPGSDMHESHAHIEFTIAASIHNTTATYITEIGVPPMDDETIAKLAAAIAEAIAMRLSPVHYYDTGEDKRVPAEVRDDYVLRELSQIRMALDTLVRR